MQGELRLKKNGIGNYIEILLIRDDKQSLWPMVGDVHAVMSAEMFS